MENQRIVDEMRMKMFSRMYEVKDKTTVASIYSNLVYALTHDGDAKNCLILALSQIDTVIQRQNQDK